MALHTHAETRYVTWLNRATEFYVVARASYFARRQVPFATCARRSIECLLIATCCYHDPKLETLSVGSDLGRLREMALGHYPEPPDLRIPAEWVDKLAWESRGDESFWADGQMLATLDRLFAEVASLVSFRTGSVLCREVLEAERSILPRENGHFAALRKLAEAMDP